jgi:hypothetical protein
MTAKHLPDVGMEFLVCQLARVYTREEVTRSRMALEDLGDVGCALRDREGQARASVTGQFEVQPKVFTRLINSEVVGHVELGFHCPDDLSRAGVHALGTAPHTFGALKNQHIAFMVSARGTAHHDAGVNLEFIGTARGRAEHRVRVWEFVNAARRRSEYQSGGGRTGCVLQADVSPKSTAAPSTCAIRYAS